MGRGEDGLIGDSSTRTGSCVEGEDEARLKTTSHHHARHAHIIGKGHYIAHRESPMAGQTLTNYPSRHTHRHISTQALPPPLRAHTSGGAMPCCCIGCWYCCCCCCMYGIPALAPEPADTRLAPAPLLSPIPPAGCCVSRSTCTSKPLGLEDVRGVPPRPRKTRPGLLRSFALAFPLPLRVLGKKSIVVGVSCVGGGPCMSSSPCVYV